MSIESRLRNLAAAGKGRVTTAARGTTIVLRLGHLSAEGDTHEIALVRLAVEMIDDRRYRAVTMETLRQPLLKQSKG